jgi:hypothetical protein
VEIAGQQHGSEVTGHAIYAASNVRGGPVTVLLEGKHYRGFLPLAANIDGDPISNLGFGAPEFNVVAYNQPPTAEPIYVEPIGAPNVCVTGGRGRVDYRFTRSASIYAWLGHYVSFSEIDPANVTCDTAPEKRTNTWDAAAGTELEFERGRSHARAWGGARHAEPTIRQSYISGDSDIFYSEGYLRYDFVKHLAGPFSLQLVGNIRRRYKPESSGRPWLEGENYTALQWSPHIAATFGYEYTSMAGCAPGQDEGFCHYVNGALQWRSGSSDTVIEQIFDTVQISAGQRRGGLKCVSGVCRFFPPFEGARLEVVSRF